jgi:hypothetical protein
LSWSGRAFAADRGASGGVPAARGAQRLVGRPLAATINTNPVNTSHPRNRATKMPVCCGRGARETRRPASAAHSLAGGFDIFSTILFLYPIGKA